MIHIATQRVSTEVVDLHTRRDNSSSDLVRKTMDVPGLIAVPGTNDSISTRPDRSGPSKTVPIGLELLEKPID